MQTLCGRGCIQMTSMYIEPRPIVKATGIPYSQALREYRMELENQEWEHDKPPTPNQIIWLNYLQERVDAGAGMFYTGLETIRYE